MSDKMMTNRLSPISKLALKFQKLNVIPESDPQMECTFLKPKTPARFRERSHSFQINDCQKYFSQSSGSLQLDSKENMDNNVLRIPSFTSALATSPYAASRCKTCLLYTSDAADE
eukprot:TRINITY_DN2271_c0_g1_i2.p1 TRINITY_DN2271_c0_g1~~TRINITY_DN2271_c0_g1_i2.p1  ORF type:complete len:115 (+),score=6.68 TRINITY_DN2271_c0_g1_i2:113-457(+)